jgi:hypothetical protein
MVIKQFLGKQCGKQSAKGVDKQNRGGSLITIFPETAVSGKMLKIPQPGHFSLYNKHLNKGG